MAIPAQQYLPAGTNLDNLYVLLAGVAAFLCVVAIGNSFRGDNKMEAKIKLIQDRRKEFQAGAVGPKKRKKPETSVNFMRAVVNRFQLLKTTQLGKTEGELIEAGFRSKDAIYVLAFFNLALPVALALLGVLVMKINNDGVSKWHAMHNLWPFAGAYIGFKLPWLYVRNARGKRYLAIQRSLSDVLDLMTICAEAGLSLAAALDRVSRELSLAYPEMAEELALTAIEMGFLPDRNKALTNLAERCKLPEVRGLVSVLVQTEKYGTPIAQALRVLSSEFRQARMLRAEQKAAKLPAMMTVPMIIFVLPTLFIVIIAPAAITLSATLGKH